MHDFNKKLRRFARMTRETMRMTHVRPQTTRRRHITSEFGLKSRKKLWGGVKIVKKIGGDTLNFFGQKNLAYLPQFFSRFSPPPTIFFLILDQIHSLYDADGSSAALRVSCALFRVSSARSAAIFC